MSMFLFGFCAGIGVGIGIGVIGGFWLLCGIDALRHAMEDYRRAAECMTQVRRDDVRVRQLELMFKKEAQAERGEQ